MSRDRGFQVTKVIHTPLTHIYVHTHMAGPSEHRPLARTHTHTHIHTEQVPPNKALCPTLWRVQRRDNVRAILEG